MKKIIEIEKLEDKISKLMVVNLITQNKSKLLKTKLMKKERNIEDLKKKVVHLEKKEQRRRNFQAEEFKYFDQVKFAKNRDNKEKIQEELEKLIKSFNYLASRMKNNELIREEMLNQELNLENLISKTIKSAYKKKAKIYHPDRNSNSIESKSMFQILAKAYEILSDKTSRALYNSVNNHNLFIQSHEKSSIVHKLNFIYFFFFLFKFYHFKFFFLLLFLIYFIETFFVLN